MTHSLHCLQGVRALKTSLKSMIKRKPISHLAVRRDRYCKEQGVATDDYVMPSRVGSRLQVLGSSPAAFSPELQEPGVLFQEFRFCAPP